MRETTCSPLALCGSLSPKRVSPRIAPLTSPSARNSALKSGEEIVGANGTTSTSSRVFSTSNPPAPMRVGTTRRLRLVGMRMSSPNAIFWRSVADYARRRIAWPHTADVGATLQDPRHGRACPGHPRLYSHQDVDARHKAGHD